MAANERQPDIFVRPDKGVRAMREVTTTAAVTAVSRPKVHVTDVDKNKEQVSLTGLEAEVGACPELFRVSRVRAADVSVELDPILLVGCALAGP